jgi:hypothetical protein
MPTLGKTLLYVCLLGVLLMVFAMYGQPEFLMMLANQLWSCF